MDDLVPWLRAQITEPAQTRETDSARAAHAAVLDAYVTNHARMANHSRQPLTNLPPAEVREHARLGWVYEGRDQGLRTAVCQIAGAYQHNPGYQAAWKQ